MKQRILAAAGALAIGLLGFAASTQAAPIDGSQSKVENSCISPIPNFVGQECSYDGSNPITFEAVGWIGPIAGPSFWNPGEAIPPCVSPPPMTDPVAGECGFVADTGQDRLPLGGDLVVTGAGAGASISGTIVIGAGSRHWGCTQADECNESWDSVTHTLAATVVDSAALNAAGGYDYEIASKGVVPLLKPCVPYFVPGGLPFPAGPFLCASGGNFANQLFPSVTPGIPFAPLFAWQNTGIIPGFPPTSSGPLQANGGLATFEGGGVCTSVGPPLPPLAQVNSNTCGFFAGVPFFATWTPTPNLGVATTAVAAGYVCSDPGNGVCAAGTVGSGMGLGGDFGYENLQLAVSTNASGGVISVTGIYTQEYQTLPFLPDPDSWDGGVLEMSGFVAVSKGGPGDSDIQIDKKNILPITIAGNADLDVTCIDPTSLALGPGEFYTLETLGGLKHPGGHISGNTFTGHFPSNDSDLRCGLNQVRLRGTCDGVPFVTSVEVNGIGKACR